MNRWIDTSAAIQEDLNASLDNAAVGDALVALFSGLRKKQGTEKQAKQYEIQIRRLADGLALEVDSGRIVVKARGSDMRTLNELRFGSDWFEGTETITETVLAGLTR